MGKNYIFDTFSVYNVDFSQILLNNLNTAFILITLRSYYSIAMY